jgi:hypothetical protein
VSNASSPSERAVTGPLDDPAALDWGRRGLSPRARRVCWALAEALYSDEDDEGRVVAADEVVCRRAVDQFDLMVGSASADLRRGFALLTWIIDLLPIVLVRRAARMTSLPVDARVAYLEAVEASPVGLFSLVLVAFKVPMTIPTFEEGDELRSTGFDRPTTASRRRLPVARASAEPLREVGT